MFYIIETREQLERLPKVDSCFIDLITRSEEAHPATTSPSVIYYNNFQKGFIFVINHSEGFELSLQLVEEFLQQHSRVYLVDGKYHSYFLNLPNQIDLHFKMLTKDPELSCYTNLHQDFYQRLQHVPNVNCLIPISKHYEKSECLFKIFKSHAGERVEWQAKYTEVYKWVEEQGIKIDEKVFDKYYEPAWKANSIRNGKIYTYYNLYNPTSRPTNAFNGINFLALPKDKSRAAFLPTNDKFIEFDFDGYHLRLIANRFGIEIPQDQSIHTYLGKLYFQKDQLTEEEYQESKKITFRQLYNGVEEKYKEIELFRHIEDAIQRLHNQTEIDGFLTLPNGTLIIVDNPTPQKLFNYFIQCLETVNNVEKLAQLKEYLKDKKSKIVLVVYDSILVDFSAEDGRETLQKIKDILQDNGYFVKLKIGDSYDFN